MEEREKALKNGRALAEEIIKSKELQYKLHLANKPLPKIPSKFKLLKAQAKSKFKQFKQLVKKVKIQTQEFIARIEVKAK